MNVAIREFAWFEDAKPKHMPADANGEVKHFPVFRKEKGEYLCLVM